MVQSDSSPRSTFEALRASARAEPYPTLAVRRERLRALADGTRRRQDDIIAALSSDFGHRSPHETRLADVLPVTNTVRYILRNLEGWARPRSRPVGMALKPASGEVWAQPLGTVGVISPWNYPFHLALVPVAYALAAGNRVMLKPSELTPATAALMVELVEQTLGGDVATVVTGGPDVAAAFSALPFDHLFYPGSARVGRLVMAAAAQNLTPVTLELGGKCPVVVHPDYPIARAVGPIAAGKLFNAGQTCVAPDYVLVHHDQADALVAGLVDAVSRRYPTLVDNPDYTAIANGPHRDRLGRLLEDARERGAEIVEINPAGESFEGSAKLAPVIVRDVTDEMLLAQEEIFGPILPVVEVGSHDEAIAYVNDRPRPLAFYVFDGRRKRVDDTLRRTLSGGVAVNDTVLHAADEALPFGGVGASGMGAYHGPEGFETFSHRRAVMRQPRLNGRFLVEPPYGWTLDRMLDSLI